jgi:hypothetical protein
MIHLVEMMSQPQAFNCFLLVINWNLSLPLSRVFGLVALDLGWGLAWGLEWGLAAALVHLVLVSSVDALPGRWMVLM